MVLATVDLEHQENTKNLEDSLEMGKQAVFKPSSKFRPPGSPAGTWPHTPWHVCVFHDPYERVNFWSHFLPGVALLVIGSLAALKTIIGGWPMAIFCVCAAVTHLLSALTHVWPDDHVLEKIDHLGIMGLLMGTPFSAIIAKDPEADLRPMALLVVLFVGGAFLKPTLRTICYIITGLGNLLFYYQIINLNLGAQCIMHLAGAYSFVRNAGHERGHGLADHHMLHYWVTGGTLLHLFYIRDAVTHQVHMHHPSIFAQQ